MKKPTDTERLDWWQKKIVDINGGIDNVDICIGAEGQFSWSKGFSTLREAIDNAMERENEST